MYSSHDRAVRRHIAIQGVIASVLQEPVAQRFNNRRAGWEHTVICGLARSGSSLLQTLVTSSSDVQSTNEEAFALDYVRRHRITADHVVTKKPADIHHCDAIRRFYEGSSSAVRFLVTVRDPRDVLTSRHLGASDRTKPFVRPQALSRRLRLLVHEIECDDTLVVRYEDVVRDPNAERDRIARFTGLGLRSDWASPSVFAGATPGEKLQGAMGAMRPVDSRSVGKWREDEEYINEILRAYPDIVGLAARLDYHLAPDPR